ncbi:MAG: NUDIX domain-containing protein [Ktedonobacterales bacterium]
MADHPRIEARPASAVVLARPAGKTFEVFMVRRHVRSEFVPNAFVFPGGSVKAEDVTAEETPSLCAPAGDGPTGLGSGFRAAALRECFEEAGVLLARRGSHLLSISPGEVERFARYRDALNHQSMTLIQIAEQEGLTLATDELLHWAHWITPEAPHGR